MIKEKELIVRSAKKEDRSNIAQIIHFESFVHRHLDWRPPLDWIGHSPYFIVEKNNRIISALACPPDPTEVSWIRVFVANASLGGDKAWDLLWPKTKETLINMGTNSIVAIPLQDWFEKVLIKNKFSHIHNVVVLEWESEKIDSTYENSNFSIRPLRPRDLETIHSIDEKAFGPIWRNSYETLELAFNQASVASVVIDDNDEICGYQISTPSPFGAHLARLAVLPEKQGLGIGYQLVKNLQSLFEERLSSRISVNTQDNNFASLALYKKGGFKLTGENYPVYQFKLFK
jgi:ribosomal protein S18 acetylase RimI-like enzyme